MAAPRRVSIIGGGPAGSAAALAALAEGAAVTLYEKSRFPRDKVCGEFLSPETGTAIGDLGLGPQFAGIEPILIARVNLHFANRSKLLTLPDPAYSLSRRSLDSLLLGEAVARGARLKVEAASSAVQSREEVVILAHGRRTPAPPGGRVFGFKSHFRGQVDNAVEMFFFPGGYVGVSPVEGGMVNVCGLAPEHMLRPIGFRPEALFPGPLREILARLEPAFDWLFTGPLVFQDGPRNSSHGRPGVYLAGDALGFIDPFTGSGILAALLTGSLAGRAAARALSPDEYAAQCRRLLARQYRVSAALRALVASGLAGSLAAFIPSSRLYRFTRPSA